MTGQSILMRLAAASALALSMAACGGGGGSGGPAFIPAPQPPPAPPPPPPTPPVSGLGVITAPAPATATSEAVPVYAVAGGPNFTTGPAAGTVFPLLQTTLVVDDQGISADADGNAAGGTAQVVAGDLTVDLLHAHDGLAGVHGFVGEVDWSGYDNLDWTRVGYWSTGGAWDYLEGPLRHRGVFVAGYETPAANMPVTGTATYNGAAEGYIYFPLVGASGTLLCKCGEVAVSGNATLTANFGTGSLAGSMTGMRVPHPWDETASPIAWHDLAFSATIVGSGFSGTTRITTVTGTYVDLRHDAAGSIDGRFFGPAANEAGAVWTLFDGTNAVIGTLTGKRP